MAHKLIRPVLLLWVILGSCIFCNTACCQAPQLVVPLAHHGASYVQLNASGDLLLSQKDQVLLVWDVNYRRVRYNLSVTGRKLLNAVFSPGGYELLLVTDDSAARLIDLRTGALLHRIRFGQTKVVAANFSGDGRRIISAHTDSSIVSWEVAQMKPLLVRKGTGIPQLLIPNVSGEYVYLEQDSTYFDESTGDQRRQRNRHLLHLSKNKRRRISGFVSFVPARNAVLRFENKARLEDLPTGRLLLSIPMSFKGEFCISGNKKYIAMGDNFEIAVWNLVSGKLEKRHQIRITSGLETELKLHAFADSNRKIVASYYNEVKALSWRSGRTDFSGWDSLQFLLDDDRHPPAGIGASGDGKRIAATYPDGGIRVFTLPNYHFPALLEGHSQLVNTVQYNQRFHRLFSMHRYKDLKCWDLQRMRLDYTITDTTFCASAYGFQFCKNEENVFIDVCEGFQGTYNVATGKPVDAGEAAHDCSSSHIGAANGTRLRQIYGKGWSIVDAQTDSLLRVIDSTNYVRQAFLSPDGRSLIVSTTVVNAYGEDSGIEARLIDLDKNDTITLLRSENILEEVQFDLTGQQFCLLSKDQGAFLFAQRGGYRQYLGEYRSAAFVHDSVLALADLSEIVLYNTKQRRLQAHLLSLQDDDFLVLLPNGYYSAHLRNLDKLHYTRKGKIVSFEQLDLRYNRPDKVLTELGSKDTLLIEAYHSAYLKRMQRLGIDTAAFGDAYAAPDGDFADREKIAAEQRGKELTIRYRATDSISTLAAFNIWVNEVPLFGAKGILLSGDKKAFDTSISIVLSRGENRIEASVRSRSGLESYRMPLFVRYIPPDSVQGRTHFIGIGVNRFQNDAYNLNWSVKDIRDLCGKLREKYPSMQVDTLFDEAVTRANIRALKNKLALLQEEDRVIVSYSGHGLLGKDLGYFLSTWNIDFQDPAVNGLPYEEFESLLDSIRPRRKLVLIDACHSGEVDKEEVARIDASQPALDSSGVHTRGIRFVQTKKQLGMSSAFELMQELFVQVSRGTGATIIAAAGGTQFAQERGDLRNGVFTYCFLEALDRFPHLTVGQLNQWLSTQVQLRTGGLQRPASRGNTNQFDWIVW